MLFGPTRNPHRLTHSVGGSSGGSAAAVATGIVPAGQASDGGGSIRIPTSACGLVGLKPSRARVPAFPERNLLAAPMTVNHAVTRSVRDTALLLDVAAGAVPGDPYVIAPASKPYAEYVGALRDLEKASTMLGGYFGVHDLLLTPTLGTVVPPLGLLDTTDPASLWEHGMSFSGTTSPFNVTGQPAISLLLGTDSSGMPVGVQLVAAQLEVARPWSTAPIWPPAAE